MKDKVIEHNKCFENLTNYSYPDHWDGKRRIEHLKQNMTFIRLNYIPKWFSYLPKEFWR